MTAERIDTAMARIEAAAARLAAAAGQLPPDAADPDLAQRHERLRREAGAALAQLDQLILELDQ